MKRRQAFTLVELLVSMALIIFMMAILSQAFIAALGVFRNLKGQGDLAEKLRSTMQMLQRDLAANHFDSNRRLSDPTFWNNGPPQQGFFQVYHGSASSATGPLDFLEGTDTSGIGSYRSIDHTLAFTVKLVGNNMGDFMTSSGLGSGNVWDPITIKPSVPQLPSNNPAYPRGLGIGAIQTFGPPESRYQPIVGTPNISGYNYQWAEVEWFLKPQINPTTGLQDTTVPDPNTGTQPIFLYTLYRRQRMLVPDNGLVSLSTNPLGGVPLAEGTVPSQAYFLEMSCWPNTTYGKLYFNSPADVTMPNRRLGLGIPAAFTTIGQDLTNLGLATTGLSALIGSDIQMNDVVSFDVRLLPLYPLGIPIPPTQVIDPFVTLFQPPFTPNAPFRYLPPPGITGMVFDTWSSINDGLNDYSQWNLNGTATGGPIPYWTPLNTTLTYQYPVGTTQTLTTPATGSGPIIRAVQVTIRIWDFKTNQTRQVTIVQAM